MGIYDRDYSREDDAPSTFSGPRTAVGILIVLNVVVFIAVYLLQRGQNVPVPIVESLLLTADWFQHPWMIWQLVTYGFVHDWQSIQHVVFNMLGLFFFGRDIEQIYGKREFTLVYLAMLVFGALVWLVSMLAMQRQGVVLGASGAVMGMTVLFALHYPHRRVLFMGFLPLPAWVMAAMYVFFDLTANPARGGVAYQVHLAGSAFAVAYKYFGWRLSGIVPTDWLSLKAWRRPKLRVHREEPDEHGMDRVQQRVDQILAKWSSEGEESLTREERQFLEEASRRYQQRRQ
ncbi:MAG: rhomboid family intramembrane serine protease [Planctomycetes bacterium]|nr:rhomboid family intramembrane serine protease [Planctomycetota bacterium]